MKQIENNPTIAVAGDKIRTHYIVFTKNGKIITLNLEDKGMKHNDDKKEHLPVIGVGPIIVIPQLVVTTVAIILSEMKILYSVKGAITCARYIFYLLFYHADTGNLHK